MHCLKAEGAVSVETRCLAARPSWPLTRRASRAENYTGQGEAFSERAREGEPKNMLSTGEQTRGKLNARLGTGAETLAPALQTASARPSPVSRETAPPSTEGNEMREPPQSAGRSHCCDIISVATRRRGWENTPQCARSPHPQTQGSRPAGRTPQRTCWSPFALASQVRPGAETKADIYPTFLRSSGRRASPAEWKTLATVTA